MAWGAVMRPMLFIPAYQNLRPRDTFCCYSLSRPISMFGSASALSYFSAFCILSTSSSRYFERQRAISG